MRWRAAIAVLLLPACGGILQAGTLSFYFRISAKSADHTIAPDIFRAIGSDAASVAAVFDSMDLLKPPPPPAGDYVISQTSDTGVDLIADYRRLDPNSPNLYFPIQLWAHTADEAAAEATISLNLTDVPDWQQIPSDAFAYIKRYNAAGVFQKRYDLRNPANHTIQWDTEVASARLATLDLIIRDSCRVADLDGSGIVDSVDFTRLAAAWRGTGPEGDVDGNEVINFDDLVILARNWLCSCNEE